MLKFGPKCVSLWHLFDGEISKEKIDEYSRNTAELIRVLGLPINYGVVKVEKKENSFIFKEIPVGYVSKEYEKLPSPYGIENPLYNESKEIRNFIIGVVFKAAVP